MDREMGQNGGDGRRPLQAGKLAWGVVLIALGGVLFIEQLDIFYFDNLIRYWPLVLVAVGAVTLATAKQGGQIRSGLWLLALGGWLLVTTVGIWGFWWDDSWPLVIIAAGLIHLLAPRSDEERWAGLVPLGIGLWCLVNTRHVGGLSWDDSWPLLLVVIGTILVSRSLAGLHKRRADVPPGPPPPPPAGSGGFGSEGREDLQHSLPEGGTTHGR